MTSSDTTVDFCLQLSQPRNLLTILAATMLNRKSASSSASGSASATQQQYLLWTLTPTATSLAVNTSERPHLVMRSESDDTTVQITATIPSEWFLSFVVNRTTEISIEVTSLYQSIMMCCAAHTAGSTSAPTITLTYPYRNTGSLGVTSSTRSQSTGYVSSTECLVHPRHTAFSRPLDLCFDNVATVNRFEGDGATLKDVVGSLVAFGASHITVCFTTESVRFVSCGAVSGIAEHDINTSGDGTYRVTCNDASMKASFLAHRLAFAMLCSSSDVMPPAATSDGPTMAASGAAAAYAGAHQHHLAAERVCVRMNESRVLSVTQLWRSSDALTHAAVELVLTPLMMES
eukprot:PhM_4_TR16170/c0_g1_i1/m.81481